MHVPFSGARHRWACSGRGPELLYAASVGLQLASFELFSRIASWRRRILTVLLSKGFVSMASYRVPAVLACWFLVAGDVSAQCCCCCTDFEIAYQTIYEPQATTQYHLEYATEYEEREIVTRRPVWQTKMRTRTYRVAIPGTETRERSFKVRRRVWETINQPRQYVVRQPVTKTVTQEQAYLTYEPVTVMRTQTVDQGQYVNQIEHTPGRTRRRLRLLRRQYYTDPLTGRKKWQRAGLYWFPSQDQGSTRVNRVWVNNYVSQKIPETTYQAKQDVRQVPVQVTEYVDRVVTQDHPVQVLNWKEETITQPYQVTTTRYEERTEDVQVRVCKMVEERKTISVPRCVAKWVPVTVTRMVPRLVVMRLPVKPGNSDNNRQPQLAAGTWHSENPKGTQMAVATLPTQHSVLRQTTTEIREITSFPAAR